jgi:hypothetical protein
MGGHAAADEDLMTAVYLCGAVLLGVAVAFLLFAIRS